MMEGDVMFHQFITKTPEEAKAIKQAFLALCNFQALESIKKDAQIGIGIFNQTAALFMTNKV